MARSNVGHLVCMYDLQYFNALFVSRLSEFLDSLGVAIETSGFVYLLGG